LSAIRRLRVPGAGDPTKNDRDKTLALRRYILGLSLVAATARTEDKYNLREGCQLRQKRGFKPVWREVAFEGDDADRHDLSPERCEEYARLAAKEFGVPKEPIDTEFDAKTAEQWLGLEEDQQKKLRVERPMTKQDFTTAAKDKKLSGTIVSIQPGTGFKLAVGKGKNKQEVDVVVDEKTVFKGKGGAASDFAALAVDGKVEVKPASGVAETVILK
jgi:hypothetical protein